MPPEFLKLNRAEYSDGKRIQLECFVNPAHISFVEKSKSVLTKRRSANSS